MNKNGTSTNVPNEPTQSGTERHSDTRPLRLHVPISRESAIRARCIGRVAETLLKVRESAQRLALALRPSLYFNGVKRAICAARVLARAKSGVVLQREERFVISDGIAIGLHRFSALSARHEHL